MPKRVLFVCTGNSCRSVMAQGLLQQQLKQREFRLQEPIEVASAGVFAIEGMSASKETVRLLQREGLDFSGHMARRLTDEMIRQSDLLVVMEQFQGEEIVRRAPEAKEKVHLLTTFAHKSEAPVRNLDIPDPIGKPTEVYEVCFATIQEAVKRLAEWLVSAGKGTR